MKRILLFTFFLVVINWQSFGSDLKIITYNVRVDIPQAGDLSWNARKTEVIELLQFYEADIFCLQEALLSQVNDIAAYMPGYDWVGVGRDNGVTLGEYTPIFYNSQKYQLKEQGWFWLSENPDSPGMGWDASYQRICTYVLLEDYDTHDNFWVFNTHLDNNGEVARRESAYLILDKIQELTKRKDPVVLTGDFNATPEMEPIKIILQSMDDSRDRSVLSPYGPEGTFNDFDIDSELDRRIDYIFVNKNIVVNKYGVIPDTYDRNYPSDHLPVYVEISF